MENQSLARDFKFNAKLALEGSYWKSVLAALIASALGVSVNFGGVNFNFSSSSEENTNVFPSKIPVEILNIIYIFVGVALVLVVANIIIGFIASTGYAKYNIELVNYRKASIVEIFKYFKYAGKSIEANLLVLLKVFLWSLLFIIPGIIAAYSYAMVPYILAENPKLETSEVLKLSKQMMKGNKWRLCWLQFTFIGWHILTVFTLGIGNILLAPYEMATQACFYKEISEEYWEYLNRIKPVVNTENAIFKEEDILFNKKSEDKIYFNGDDFRI